MSFVGRNQVIALLRAAYRKTDFRLNTSLFTIQGSSFAAPIPSLQLYFNCWTVLYAVLGLLHVICTNDQIGTVKRAFMPSDWSVL